jgi:hypothetical protein
MFLVQSTSFVKVRRIIDARNGGSLVNFIHGVKD